MLLTGRMDTNPVPVVRQTRSFPLRGGTTLKPGRFMPVAYYNLLREDSSQGSIPFAIEMRETHELLMNKVYARVSAWFIPHSSLARFEKNPTFFQKSYQGEEPMAGKAVIPFIQTHAYGTAGSNLVYKYLGLFEGAAVQVNTSPLESYNNVWNFVAMNRSKSLDQRTELDGTLAPAFWAPNNMSEIVPTFDDSLIAGEVPLTVVAGRLPVSGLGVQPATVQTATGIVKDTKDPTGVNYDRSYPTASNNVFVRAVGSGAASAPDVYAEMEQNGITVSLANLEQARKLVSWAKLRERYEGHSDEWIIDTLMQGFHVEDMEWMQPMLLSQQTVQFKQGLRYASNAPDLNEHATNGVAAGRVNVTLPPNKYGGVIMLFAEVIPEQLYERQPDPWFTATTVDDLPNYYHDVNNPMPVEEVLNGHVDSSHSNPTGLFGWARRNWRWLKWPTRLGGDLFVHTASTATTEARRVVWPTDVADPALSEEFYVSTTLGVTPFMDQSRDQFIMSFNGQVTITGLTLIGTVHESEANYDKVREQNPPLERPTP